MQENKIYISRTPLRVSFFGGGTDMPYFYEKYGGYTISTTIKKYIYVVVKRHNNFQEKYRLNYSITENVNSINKIRNLRIKMVLKNLKISTPLFLSTFSDIPTNTGLGSSSAFTVGLINVLLKISKKKMSKGEIAEMAYNIEKKITKNSIGKQDHYIASFGGFKFTNYSKKKVSINKINISNINQKKLFNNSYMLWTGITRQASSVLKDQQNNFKNNIDSLKEINNVTKKIKNEFEKKKINLKKIGKFIDYTWMHKKKFSKLVTNYKVDNIYDKSLDLGSYGGKLLGAGNGGFIFFLAGKKEFKKIKKYFKNYKIFEVEHSENGSEII